MGSGVSFFIKSKLGITWRKIRGKWLDLDQGDGKGELELGGPGIEHQRGGGRVDRGPWNREQEL